MYRLKAKEEANNTTRKRFRGGQDSQVPLGGEPIAQLNELPVDQSQLAQQQQQPMEAVPPLGEQPLGSQTNEYVSQPLEAQTNEYVSQPLDAQTNEYVSQPLGSQTNEFVAPPNPIGEVPSVGEQSPMFDLSSSVSPSEQSPIENGFGSSLEAPPVGTPITGEGESAEIEAFRNMMGTPEAQQVYLYMNTNISTEENRDKSYKREGVLHFTDSVSVGANQNTIMSLGSVIGNRGIETTTYDKLRNIALQKVGIILGESRRCYNTKIGFERNGETILVHIYGTVYMKKSEQPTI